jgi:hypothetical protein
MSPRDTLNDETGWGFQPLISEQSSYTDTGSLEDSQPLGIGTPLRTHRVRQSVPTQSGERQD